MMISPVVKTESVSIKDVIMNKNILSEDSLQYSGSFYLSDGHSHTIKLEESPWIYLL